ncbi:DUF2946 family protein [Hyphomicrobium sp.]|uniref:DUF2946 family protein n=1 Tax=Hyphomicrobium sp. TaxID=82 RepID=UPI001D29B22D|nr:DUF2946 family protein [Hyphomicrobium sp.]MBY0560269.1 hypothetical protein [Hyphomicrobium sp.]
MSALAILGAILNAWVLTVHITSVAVTQLEPSGGNIVICHKGSLKYLADEGTPGEKPEPQKSCPICSGLASLDIGIASEPSLHVAPVALGHIQIGSTSTELVADHRPEQILNRGPPLLV